jgi:hypothetical protein
MIVIIKSSYIISVQFKKNPGQKQVLSITFLVNECIHKIVIINKQLHDFSTVYFKKNLGEEWMVSQISHNF